MNQLFIGLSLVFGLSAQASEGLFGYIYTLDNTPEGHWEYEQKQTLRSGKARGTYQALDLRNEFEYGITNDFQVAFYLNSFYLNQKNVPTEDLQGREPNHNEFNIRGASVEFFYRALSPYKDGIGLGFYLEPEMSIWDAHRGGEETEKGLEGRVILQKNFLGDTLVTAFNIMAEPEWRRSEEGSGSELYLEYTLGASYRIKSNWFVGLELRNHNEYPKMNLGHPEHSAWFFGPNVHYATQKYWVTLTALPQISGWPKNLGNDANGQPVADANLHLGEHERTEVRLMFGIPFGSEGHAHD